MVGTEACGGQLAIGPTRLARFRRRGLCAVETRCGRRPNPPWRPRPRSTRTAPIAPVLPAPGSPTSGATPRRRAIPAHAGAGPIEPGDNAGRHPAMPEPASIMRQIAEAPAPYRVRRHRPGRPVQRPRDRGGAPRSTTSSPSSASPFPCDCRRPWSRGTTTTRRSAPQVRAAGPSSGLVTPPRRRRTGLRAAPARCRVRYVLPGQARATVPGEETGEPLRPPRRPHRGIGEPPCLRTPAWSPSSASDSSMPASKARMAQQGLARRTHHHAVEAQSRQVHASLPFQRGDVSAGGRQRPVRGSGGAGEAARFRHPHEQGQGSDIRQHRRWPGAAGADDHAGPACAGGRPAQRAARAACCSSRVRATLSRR